MAPRLIIDIADKRFGEGQALFSGFRLAVEPGEVVAVLGPSGIGKSTLLRLAAGIDHAFSGSITLDGVDAADAGAPGFVFQDARLLPWLTALDNVLLADPAADGVGLLREVGLTGVERLFPHQLSGGMQRRVALARALAARAGLLLLDEPFASLDQALHAEMCDLLASVLDSAKATTILVSHDAEDAARLADRVIVFAGKPVQVALDMTLPGPRAKRDESIVAHHVALLGGRPHTLT